MPTMKVLKDRFHELMGESYEFDVLDSMGFEFGIQVQEDKQFDKELNIDLDYYKFDCMNNRPDLLSQNSLARAWKIYMGKCQTPQMKLTKPREKLIVQNSVNCIRPYAVAAILKNISFNEKTYKSFIATQEKLHATFCRARKYASLGTHDYDTIKGPFRYVARKPTQFQFVPLNQKEKVDGLGMMLSLEGHKLKQYLPLIRQSPVYPLILDAEDRVCSVPPIINSEHSKISINTKNVFIEVTALSKPKALTALNTLVWAFSEFCQIPFEIQPVQVVMENQTFLTPDIEEKQFLASHKKAQKLIGAPLTSQQIIAYLKRMGLKAVLYGDGQYKVKVPSWRSDVLHQCDILEDIAICYGYQKIVPTLPPSSTIGSQLRINKFTDCLRHQMAQAQYNQALNFALCSKADLTSNIFNNDESSLITIQNAKTKQFQTGRTTLLPGLIRTIIQNKSMALPFRLFQTGDCIVADKNTDTGAKNIRKLAAAITDQVTQNVKKDIFSQVHGTLDVIMQKSAILFGKHYTLEVGKSQFYFPGQQFDVVVNKEIIGNIGVVDPKVLRKFGWNHPIVMWQLNIASLQQQYTRLFQG